MDGKLDDFLANATGSQEREPDKKKRRLKSTSLESFLPEEQINYFKKLRIGSKKMRNAKIDGL
ncbi:hypothetical protein A3L12_07955 [Thermococcus sp. P6]|uniref:PCNA-inhibitor n=1 Tax=Thermococcus sp. P6 TaxID=122420 RepID=UPI000B59E2E4|nr:PCNA-inhibitor [Thermococcus sp. P6]ASJ11229.1 hypothetical protein A3L12_07955 [Thermococcus sp. P6]